ncbi:MAG TPA: hypothetical protein VN081_00355 [Dongiaceae bacterium]|nr:hypothetical protein [Dongiaceae bacterium]
MTVMTLEERLCSWAELEENFTTLELLLEAADTLKRYRLALEEISETPNNGWMIAKQVLNETK